MMTKVELHPNYGECIIRVDGSPYYWDGHTYRTGHGPYATTTMIGEWQVADKDKARRVLRDWRRRP